VRDIRARVSHFSGVSAFGMKNAIGQVRSEMTRLLISEIAAVYLQNYHRDANLEVQRELASVEH
jgi:hypothetical protein